MTACCNAAEASAACRTNRGKTSPVGAITAMCCRPLRTSMPKGRAASCAGWSSAGPVGGVVTKSALVEQTLVPCVQERILRDACPLACRSKKLAQGSIHLPGERIAFGSLGDHFPRHLQETVENLFGPGS